MSNGKENLDSKKILKTKKPILGRRKVEDRLKKEIIAKKTKAKKEKTSGLSRPQRFKIATRNFPLLMTREMRRVRWVKRNDLNKSFWLTTGFITFFAIFFAIFATIIQEILKLIRVL